MALVRNAVGIVADVSDAEASRLLKVGWASVDAPQEQPAPEKPKRTPRKRASAKPEASTEEQD